MTGNKIGVDWLASTGTKSDDTAFGTALDTKQVARIAVSGAQDARTQELLAQEAHTPPPKIIAKAEAGSDQAASAAPNFNSAATMDFDPNRRADSSLTSSSLSLMARQITDEVAAGKSMSSDGTIPRTAPAMSWEQSSGGMPLYAVAQQVHDQNAATDGPDNVFYAMGRVARVTLTGAGIHGLPGMMTAIGNDYEHKGNFFEKLAGGAAVGVVMKLVLPQKGVARGIAATVMIGTMAKDVIGPTWDAWSTAWNTRDEKELDKASEKLGDALGNFAWDTSVGIAGGKMGEMGTGWGLRKSLGTEKYSAFETAKETFFEKREGKVGRYLVPMAETFDRGTAWIKDTLAPERTEPILSEDQMRERVREAMDRIVEEKKHMLYKSPLFSRYIDGQTGEKPIIAQPNPKLPNLAEARARIMGRNWDDMAQEPIEPNGEKPGKEGEPGPLKPPVLPVPKDTTGSGRPKGPDISPTPEGDSSPIRDDGAPIRDGDLTPKPKAPQPGDLGDKGSEPPLPVPADKTGETKAEQPPPPNPEDVIISIDVTEPAKGDGEKPVPGTGDTTKAGEQPVPGSSDTTKAGEQPTGTGDTTKGTEDPTKVGEQPKVETKPDTGDKTEVNERPAVRRVALTPEQEINPATLGDVAKVAKDRQDKWAQSPEDERKGLPSKASLEDFQDMVRGPIVDVSDASRNGALLPPEFKASAMDLSRIITEELKTHQGYAEAGPLVEWHALAANQLILKDRDTLALNMLAQEIYGTFLKNMRRIKVTDNLLENRTPSLVARADDRGSGNFTIPEIEGLLRRAITIFPRSQTELIPVFGPINFHENLGHDHVFPLIALITRQIARERLETVMNDEYRHNVIMEAVKKAFGNNHIEDADMQVGDKTMKKSEVFAQMLLAEANENTADMIGTAASGLGTPLSLAVLLQSLRPSGNLETRNVFGSQFTDLFEPHGFDRWRVKLSAQTLRHLSKGDKVIDSFADALDSYAAKASRPGDDYTYASTDQPGQMIRIKQSEWDAIIPHIVETQFDTPLPALKTPDGMKTLTDVLPEFKTMFHKTNDLATKISDAVAKNSTRLDNFDKDAFRNEYTIGNVFNASLLAWIRSRAQGEDPSTSLDTIRGIFNNLRDIYIEHNPHQVPLTEPFITKFTAAPISTLTNSAARWSGNVLDSRSWRSAIPRTAPYAGGAVGATYLPMLFNLKRNWQDLPDDAQNPIGFSPNGGVPTR